MGYILLGVRYRDIKRVLLYDARKWDKIFLGNNIQVFPVVTILGAKCLNI